MTAISIDCISSRHLARPLIGGGRRTVLPTPRNLRASDERDLEIKQGQRLAEISGTGRAFSPSEKTDDRATAAASFSGGKLSRITPWAVRPVVQLLDTRVQSWTHVFGCHHDDDCRRTFRRRPRPPTHGGGDDRRGHPGRSRVARRLVQRGPAGAARQTGPGGSVGQEIERVIPHSRMREVVETGHPIPSTSSSMAIDGCW